MSTFVEAIDNCLPQTQCAECSYPGCKPYAIAIVEKGESIDRCPPGGIETMVALSKLTGQSVTQTMRAKVAKQTRPPQLAVIDEAHCIGCTKCIKACPVDAIIGSAKKMHTIISDECTGCGLCVDPCPVDCIDMLPMSNLIFDKTKALTRFTQKNKRLEVAQQKERSRYQTKRRVVESTDHNHEILAKQDYIQAARERVKAKKEKSAISS